MTHAVFLSGGADSTSMALRLKEVHPEIDFRYVCTPTGDELPEMVAHWDRLGVLLGKPIEHLAYPGGLATLIEQNNSLPSFRLRFCTRVLKIQQAIAFYAQNSPCVSYVGLRSDEEDREGGVFGDSVEQRYPLREWGWDRAMVLAYLKERGISVPKRTDCARCPFQRLSDWWFLLRDHPDLYASAEADEERFGHTYRSPQRDNWPAALKDLRVLFEQGKRPRGLLKALKMADEDAPEACRVCRL